MDLVMYTVDAFAREPFGGNPAAVCVLQNAQMLNDVTMQRIAFEMNLSETAFIQELQPNTLSTGDRFGLRWFTPTNEVKLCGHATLASAAVLLRRYANSSHILNFETLSGVLTAKPDGDMIVLDLPLANITDEVPDVCHSLLQKLSPRFEAIRSELVLVYSPNVPDLLVRLPQSWTREDLESIPIPDTSTLLTAHDGSEVKGIILTTDCAAVDAFNKPYDFVSRYFAAWNGIPEDPVTGAAHTVLGRYWSQQMKKTQFYARQCSSRGGDLTLTVDNSNNRVYIGGQGCIILTGSIHLPSQNN